MKELQKAYDSLVSQHDELLAKAEKEVLSVVYAQADFSL